MAKFKFSQINFKCYNNFKQICFCRNLFVRILILGVSLNGFSANTPTSPTATDTQDTVQQAKQTNTSSSRDNDYNNLKTAGTIGCGVCVASCCTGGCSAMACAVCAVYVSSDFGKANTDRNQFTTDMQGVLDQINQGSVGPATPAGPSLNSTSVASSDKKYNELMNTLNKNGFKIDEKGITTPKGRITKEQMAKGDFSLLGLDKKEMALAKSKLASIMNKAKSQSSNHKGGDSGVSDVDDSSKKSKAEDSTNADKNSNASTVGGTKSNGKDSAGSAVAGAGSASANGAGERDPASTKGFIRTLANGEKIGVASDSIFLIINQRYDSLNQDGGFYKE